MDYSQFPLYPVTFIAHWSTSPGGKQVCGAKKINVIPWKMDDEPEGLKSKSDTQFFSSFSRCRVFLCCTKTTLSLQNNKHKFVWFLFAAASKTYILNLGWNENHSPAPVIGVRSVATIRCIQPKLIFDRKKANGCVKNHKHDKWHECEVVVR